MFNKMPAVLALTAAAVLLAQNATPTRPTPEQNIERRLEYLTALLNLETAQVTQIRTILTEEQTALSVVSTSARQAQDALRTAVEALSPDATIDSLAAQVGTLQGQATAIRAKYQVKFLSVLTADQRTKLGKLGGPGGFGPGGPGPRGFGPAGTR